jgi:hypothetical protein
MMNRVRKNDSPIKTILGGMVVRPKACLKSENTIKIRVKLVNKISAAGKKLSAVKARRVSTGTEYVVLAPVPFVVTNGRVCAHTMSGRAIRKEKLAKSQNTLCLN